ncbi:hypothetical protein, partial [Xanthomonas arboricola]|uniref:hypothetical protein n=1 Tax=Xanthomonas arboricola TaxID=56448 RepID=UPI001955D16F
MARVIGAMRRAGADFARDIPISVAVVPTAGWLAGGVARVASVCGKGAWSTRSGAGWPATGARDRSVPSVALMTVGACSVTGIGAGSDAGDGRGRAVVRVLQARYAGHWLRASQSPTHPRG